MILLLSGGLDSATLLYKARAEGVEVEAVVVDYGQHAAKQEERAAMVLCMDKAIAHFVKRPLLRELPSMESKDVVIPARNLLLITTAVEIAITRGHGEVQIGCNKQDGALFPDCFPRFVVSLHATCVEAYGVGIRAPLINMTKAQVWQLASELGVPTDQTWSCYAAGKEECGKCLACEEVIACRLMLGN